MRPFPILFVLCLTAIAAGRADQAPPPPVTATPSLAITTPPAAVTPTPTLDAALREEASQYRLYLTNLADQLKYVVGILVLFGGAFIGFLNWRSRSDIEKQINARFQTTIDRQLDSRLQKFDRDIEEARKSTSENFYRIDRLVDSFGDFASALTLAFYVLNQRSKTEEWEKDRQQAIAELQAVRKDLPDWRRVAILLGRLFKANEEYGPGVGILQEVMKYRDEAGMARDTDYAALLFNCACYQNLQAKSLSREKNAAREMVESLRNAAWDNLKYSVWLEPANLGPAKEDSDFDSLWNDTTRPKERLEEEARRSGTRPVPPPKAPGKVWKWLHKLKA